MRKIVFLDRDGTLIQEKNYLSDPKDVTFETWAITGLHHLKSQGYDFIIITNQSGIARGYFTESDFWAVQKHIESELKSHGISILDTFFCPYHPEGKIPELTKESHLRKPNPGMIELAFEKYKIDKDNSFMIGDKAIDIEAGNAAGLKSILVQTGYAETATKASFGVSANLFDAALLISRTPVLVVSNGFGEDQIGATLTKAIRQVLPNSQISAFPLVGTGKEYQDIGLTPAIQNKMLPSGGFIRCLGDFWGDVRAGLVGQILDQIKALRRQPHPSFTLVAGDFFALLMAKLGRIKGPVFFLPTAKSHHFMKHSWLEKWGMKRWATAVFTRDQETADDLKKDIPQTYYLGNPMMDILFSDYTPITEDTAPIVGVLPGSRDEAVANTGLVLDLISSLHTPFPATFAISVSKHLSKSVFETLLKEKGATLEDTYWHLDGKTILLTENYLGLLHQSKVIIGLAGTANEQAAYLGKPVLCFEGTGPQTTTQRFLEQSKLFSNIRFLPNRLEVISAIDEALKTPKEKQEISPAAPPLITFILSIL